MTTIFTVVAAWYVVLKLLAFLRIVLGPTVPDRLVGLDAINTLVIATMFLLSAVFRETWLVDVAVVYALLSYVGTLFFARHFEEDAR
jgi:multicomponent Na+:H+ antiporter subunit F